MDEQQPPPSLDRAAARALVERHTTRRRRIVAAGGDVDEVNREHFEEITRIATTAGEETGEAFWRMYWDEMAAAGEIPNSVEVEEDPVPEERRASTDQLLSLPPNREEVRAFVQREDPDGPAKFHEFIWTLDPETRAAFIRIYSEESVTWWTTDPTGGSAPAKAASGVGQLFSVPAERAEVRAFIEREDPDEIEKFFEFTDTLDPETASTFHALYQEESNARHEREMAAIDAEHARNMAEIEAGDAQYEREMAAIEAEHAREMARIEAEYAREMAKIAGTNQQLEQRREDLDSSLRFGTRDKIVAVFIGSMFLLWLFSGSEEPKVREVPIGYDAAVTAPAGGSSASSSIPRSRWQSVARALESSGAPHLAVEPYNPNVPGTMRIIISGEMGRAMSAYEARELAANARSRLGDNAIVYVKDGTGKTLGKAAPWGVE